MAPSAPPGSATVKTHIWECNIKASDAHKIITEQTFWSDVLQAWCEVHYHEPQMREEVETQIIWYNSHIRITDKMVPLPKNGTILTISDIRYENRFMTYFEFNRKVILK